LSLVLNFSPIGFDDFEIKVGQLPYGGDGEEVLKQLREEHNATHVFRREGKDSILVVPLAPEASLLGEPKAVRLKENLGLAAALVRNALLTYLAGMGRTVLSYDPLKFIARRDLLRVNAPHGIAPPDWRGQPRSTAPAEKSAQPISPRGCSRQLSNPATA